MNHETSIGWTHWPAQGDVGAFKGVTWNPVTGCTPIGPGCKNCYAQRQLRRKLWDYGTDVTCHPKRLTQPLHWKKQRCVFVCSMADLFHEDVPVDYVRQVFEAMKMAPRHRFLVLTKRPHLMSMMLNQWCDTDAGFAPNIGLGVTVENQEQVYRIDFLNDTPAAMRFVSVEPMLGSIVAPMLGHINVSSGLDWVICGGENGPGCRSMLVWWADNLYSQCRNMDIPFFFKGMGTMPNGRTKRATPAGLDVHEFPLWPGVEDM